MTAAAPRNVGFIGLGVLGAPLARNLVEAGHLLAVFDTRPEAVAALTASGAKAAASAAEVASRAEVVFVCVANDEEAATAVAGDDGVLAGAKKGAIVVLLSTVSPQTVAALGAAAAACDVEVVDAPLTGGAEGAAMRAVLYMVGGTDQAVASCAPLLELTSRKLIRAGGPGAGARAKLVHQLVMCGNLLAAREGWALGLASGLSPGVIADVVASGASQSRVADLMPSFGRGPRSAALYRKDLKLCLDLGRALGVRLPGAALTETLVDDLVVDPPNQTAEGR